MKVKYHADFDRDLARSKDAVLAKQVRKLIMRLENVSSLKEIPNLKKLSGGTNFYRVRIGDYRVGLTSSGSSVMLMRVMHRKEIYRYFP